MCDYSLHTVKSRPAKVGERLTTHHFNTGTPIPSSPANAIVLLHWRLATRCLRATHFASTPRPAA